MLNSNLDDANIGSEGIVGFLAAKMSWSFGWDVMHDPMDRSNDDAAVAAQAVEAARATATASASPVMQRHRALIL